MNKVVNIHIHKRVLEIKDDIDTLMCIIIIIMCVALFVCVASTLAWDYDMQAIGMGEKYYGDVVFAVGV